MMPLLSLCMIVKNEELFLEDCLNSVKDLVDEVIIVDTGSTDNTKEIARKFTVKIYDFKWCDDFAVARNESLKYATGDWILVLDADEVISKEDHGRIKLNLDVPKEISGFLFIQRNYVNYEDDLTLKPIRGFNVKEGGSHSFIPSKNDKYAESINASGWLPVPVARLFRREQAFYSGIVHEDICASLKGKMISTEIPIHHFGKMNNVSWEKKKILYESLGRKKIEIEKDHIAYFELGRQYLANNKIEAAKQMFLESININNSFWFSWFNLGGIHLVLDQLEKAEHCLLKAIQLNPGESSLYNNLAVTYAKKKKFEKAIAMFEHSLQIDPNQASIFKNMGLCYDELGDKNKAYLSFKKAIELEPSLAETIKLGQ